MAAPLQQHVHDNKALLIVNKLLNQISTQNNDVNTNDTSLNDKFSTKLKQLPNIQIFSKRIICILGQNPGKFKLQGTNTYLIGTGKQRFLIDTGEGKQSYIPLLKQAMNEHQIESIKGIICTHWHYDHIGGIESIQKEFGLNKKIPIYKHVSNDMDDKLNLNYISIKNGDTLSCEGGTLNIYHTPGHTDDHVSIKLIEDNVVFCGDCILGEGSCVFNDLYLYMMTLNKLLSLKCDKMYSGHGPQINNAKNKINHYIKHRNNREQQIIYSLKKNINPITSLNLCDLVYNKTPQHLKKAAHKNLLLHLNKLIVDGTVKKTHDDKYVFIK